MIKERPELNAFYCFRYSQVHVVPPHKPKIKKDILAFTNEKAYRISETSGIYIFADISHRY